MSRFEGEVGIIFHPAETQGTECLAGVCDTLDEHNVVHWQVPRDNRNVRTRLKRTRLLLTLGGDGTFMHGARLAAPDGIPVLGINLGRLGFLTELEPRDIGEGLPRVLAGDFRVEERIVVSADLMRGARRLANFLAINEVVVHKGSSGRLVRLQVEVDGQDVGTIDADGILTATSTGSTAYALALGGPILEPNLEGLLMVPMNPFALTVRPIVFPPGQALRVTLVLGDGMLTADGFLNRNMRQGDHVSITPYERPLRVVRLTERDRFFERLREKIGWGTPLVPLR